MKNILKKIYENQDFSNIYGDLINKIIETLAKDLAKMHNNNVIHGDLTTSNLLMIFDQVDNVEETILNKKDFYSIYFIDFGLSYISPHNEDKAVDLYVLRRAIISSNPKSELIVSFLIHNIILLHRYYIILCNINIISSIKCCKNTKNTLIMVNR